MRRIQLLSKNMRFCTVSIRTKVLIVKLKIHKIFIT